MAQYDYVIFDFDGTVADTGEGILKSLQYSFEQMGREVPDMSDLKRFIGPPVYYSYTHFYGVSEEEVETYIRKYRERYKEKGIYECRIYDGMKELLYELKSRGVKVGIASSKPEHLIYSVADFLDITSMFDVIVGVKSDNSRHSTKKDIILEAMEKLGAADKEKVLMVGDRCFDIEGAAEAGVKSCGAIWGYGNKEEFLKHKADMIAEEPLDVVNFI